MNTKIFVEDEHGNRATIERWGSEEKAREALRSCTGCHDCSDCLLCTDCSCEEIADLIESNPGNYLTEPR